MSFTAKDALKLFEIDWDDVRARYIKNNLEYKIEQVFNDSRSITIDGVINKETEEVSILFPQYLFNKSMNVGLTKDIFDLLKDHGYDIYYEYTFDESNKYNDNSNLYKNAIKIEWFKANEKTINLKPKEIKMITAQVALNHYKELNKLANKYIDEIIVPEIKEVAKTQKFVKFPVFNIYYQGYSFNFSKEYSKYKVNIELSRRIFDKLKKNGFTLQFEDENYATEYKDGNGYLKIKWGE